VTRVHPPVDVDEQRIDAIFAHLDQCRLPGAAVGVAVGGRAVYRRAFGLATAELPVMLSPSMRMRIGSTTKHFTALAYMLLCEEGRASPDDRVRRHLPELHEVTRDVTMRHLMGNISGLRDATDIVQQLSGAEHRLVSTDDLLSLYRSIDDVSAPPGSTYIYNNGGWVLLSAAIERLSGQSLEQVMWERVFEPLGMYDTRVRRWDYELVPNSASPHAMISTGVWHRGEYCGGIDYAGAGAIVSTVDDMLKWMAHMDRPKVGSAATWALMRTPQTLANGTSTGYGFGLATGSHRGLETLSHSGGGNGSNAQMLQVPAAGLDIIVMVNRADISSVALAEQVLDACLPHLPPDAPPASGHLPAGIFRSQRTGRVVQLLVRDGDQIASMDGFDMPVERDADGTLRPVKALASWKRSITLIGSAEHPTALRVVDFGNADELLRLTADEADAKAVEGRYRSDAIETEATIRRRDAGLCLHTENRWGSSTFRLEYLCGGIWRASAVDPLIKPLASVLSFDADGDGFGFSNILTRNLRFRRVV
jgi:D-aminopeptidase